MGDSIKVAAVFAVFGLGLIVSALMRDQGTLRIGGRDEEEGTTVVRIGREDEPPSIDTGIPLKPFVIVLGILLLLVSGCIVRSSRKERVRLGSSDSSHEVIVTPCVTGAAIRPREGPRSDRRCFRLPSAGAS